MNNKQRLIISVVTFLAFALMSVGFATYRVRLNVTGVATFSKNGKIAITNVRLISSNNITDLQDPTFTDDSINFNLNFSVENQNELAQEYSATYEITMTNDSFYNYIFASNLFVPSIETTNNENLDVAFSIEGIDIGDIIPSKDVVTFTAILDMYPKDTGDYNVSGEVQIGTEQGDTPPTYSLMGSIPKNTTLDLTGSTTMQSVKLTVINTYPESKTFNISNSGNSFSVVNSSGNALGTLSVGAEDTEEYYIYIKRRNGVTFPSSPQKINLYFTPTDGNRTGLGSISILVDVDNSILDDEPPIISNVNADIVYEDGKIKVTWDATDDSGIDHFIIEMYNDSDTLLNTITTSDSSEEYTFSSLSAGTYYFKVYGVDNSSNHNNGQSVSTTCTTSDGYCSRSTSSSYQWTFNVTNSCSNCTFTGNNSVFIGSTYTATVRASNWYNLPDTITVTMNNTQLSTSQYTYNQNNGSISIPNVTGNLNIQVTASFACLVKGTKILLANGEYKNIENITYNDLLAVWNYETGSLTYEYPIWLENKAYTNKYTKTTFSDGTYLKTVALHGLFSPTYNEFISVNDSEKYKVGTKILKIVDGKFKEVTIKKIETINEKVEYYHVVSTRYYNIIANDILTTDGTVILSNLYGFSDKITWPSVRNEIMASGLYSYNEFKDIMPYYMFKGLRVEEGKVLQKYGYTKDIFRYYLLNNQLNEHMMKKIDTSINGKRLWMVSTSLDEINELNMNNFLHEEGSMYKLPNALGVRKWYSTSENKYYNPSDTIEVVHGMHFIAIK